MKPFKFILTALFFITISSCNSTFYTVSTNTDHINNAGIIYALPKTKLNINIEITEIYKQKGPFSDYTYLYFNTKNAIKKNEVKYKISGISVETIPVLDSSNIYCINTKKNNTPNLVNLTPEGFIAGINLNDYRAEKIQIEQKNVSELTQKNKILDYADFSLKSIQETKFDTIYKEVIKDSVLVRIPIIKKKKVFKSVEKQAKEIAEVLFLLRDDRNALLTGENDGNNFPDGNALKTMLIELSNLEKQYMSLFTGQEVKIKKNYNLSIIPEKSKTDSLLFLFSFSKNTGISFNNSQISKNNIYLKLNKNDKLKFTKEYTDLNNKKNKNAPKGLKGLIYIIPADISSEVIYNNTVILEKLIKISQLGTLNLIPSKILQENISIEFYPQYGSLKRISKIKSE
ncbi:MAG: DUF4831 family protein [Bacteroidales bacterium]|nr:DUF4831 family protein [Bacteroidales bacterium]